MALAAVVAFTCSGAGAASRPALAQSREIGAAGVGATVPDGCRESEQHDPSGWLYTPVHAAPAPAVVMLHKGFAYNPARARAATFQLGRTYASHLCPLGIAVRSVDYRESTLGGPEMLDVDAAFDSLARQPDLVDARRVAVMGGSHGGYMTLLALARHHRPFVGGVALYGFADVSRVLQQHVIDNPSTRATIARAGSPRDRAGYHSIDVRLRDITQPLLLVTGDTDEFVAEMRRIHRSVPAAEYVEISGGTHGFEVGDGPATEQLWHRATTWLVRALAPAPPGPAA